MSKRSSTPTDESRLARWIVDHVTIEAKAQSGKNSAAAALGRVGQLKGRTARAAKGRAIAKKATKAKGT